MRHQIGEYGAVALAILLTLGLQLSGSFSQLENTISEWRFQLLQKEASDDIVVVEIDARSIRSISTWPWSRALHAQVIDRLNDADVKQVFFDVDFSAPSADQQADRALAESLARAGSTRIVLPSFWQPLTTTNSNEYILTRPLPMLAQHGEVGMVNVAPGPDGLVREIVHLERSLTEQRFSIAALMTGTENLQSDRPYPVDLSYRPDSFKRVSYIDLLEGNIAPEILAGKTVYIGATALELGDNISVPLYRSVPGILLQALAFETLSSKPLNYAPPMLGTAACALIIPILFGLRKRSWRSFLLTLTLLGTGSFGASIFIQAQYGWLISIVPMNAFLLLSGLLNMIRTLDKQALQLMVEKLKALRHGALLSSMLEASTDSIVTLDERGTISSANPAARKLLASDSSLIGEPIATFFPCLNSTQDLLEAVNNCNSRERMELQASCPQGQVPVELSLTKIDVDNETLFSAIIRDITEQKQQRELLRHQATHDPLTGLPNRSLLAEGLDQLDTGRNAALLMLDLDRFKEINDTLGHSAGDEVLVLLGERLVNVLSDNMLIARIGGDEFAILVSNHTQPEELETLAKNLLSTIRTPIKVMGVSLEVGASIGIVFYPEHGEDRESLLRLADIAMYNAKKEKTGFQFYDPNKDGKGLRKLEIAAALRPALEADELDLFYQPKIALSDGSICGFEALSRWQHERLGFVSPVEFVTLAEETDLIEPLTWWTIERALSDMNDWRKRGVSLPIALNMSARHLTDKKFYWKFMQTLKQADIEPALIQLEITESALMADPQSAIEITSQLHEAGISLAVDDFGTGFSSLAYLKNLNVDTLKIDRCFITELDVSHDDQHIVSSTINMAHGLGISVIAEGIETKSQLDLLKQLGCDTIQGYYLAKPMPKQEVLDWIASSQPQRDEIRILQQSS